LSSGMVTPKMRGMAYMKLSLALFMLGDEAQTIQPFATTYDLALFTDGFDGRANLHEIGCPCRSIAVDDASARTVGRDFDADFVSHQDLDVAQAHLPRQVGQHYGAVLELDAECGVGEGLDDRPDGLCFFLVVQRVRLPEDILAEWPLPVNAPGGRRGYERDRRGGGAPRTGSTTRRPAGYRPWRR